MHSFNTDLGHGRGGRFGHEHLCYRGQRAKGSEKGKVLGRPCVLLLASFLEDMAVWPSAWALESADLVT